MQKLGIQSYTFNASRDLDFLLDRAGKCGCRLLGMSNFHIDWSGTIPEIAEKVKRIHDRGIQVASIGPVGNIAGKSVFEAARTAGTTVVAATFSPTNRFLDAMVRAAEMASEFGCVVAIHNHGAYDWLGGLPMLEYIFANTPDNFGLCLDTAWAVDAASHPGETAVTWVEKFALRLFNIHLKDFTYDRNGNREEWVIGDGQLDVGGFVKACLDRDYRGDFLLEYESNETDDEKNRSVARGLAVAAKHLGSV